MKVYDMRREHFWKSVFNRKASQQKRHKDITQQNTQNIKRSYDKEKIKENGDFRIKNKAKKVNDFRHQIDHI